MEKALANLIKIANYDLKVAEGCYKDRFYITSVEKCHNALEKILKAIIVSNEQNVPKIHDLYRLTQEAVIENLQSDIKLFLDELNDVYMNTRYPDDFDTLEDELTEKEVGEILRQTKRIFSWLKKKIA